MNARSIIDLIVYGIKATFKKITCSKSGFDAEFKENEVKEENTDKNQEIVIEF